MLQPIRLRRPLQKLVESTPPWSQQVGLSKPRWLQLVSGTNFRLCKTNLTAESCQARSGLERKQIARLSLKSRVFLCADSRSWTRLLFLLSPSRHPLALALSPTLI